MSKTKKMVLLGILVSQALVLHIVERSIPVPIPVYGVKLGLANIISLFTIIILGFKEAIIVVALRTLLGSIFGGGVTAFLYSISGGILSTIVMYTMYRKYKDFFSIPVISVVGAVFHNLGQISVASLVVANSRLFYYMPVLAISGVITGLLIGFVVQYTMEPLSRILRLK